ncbi:hypothetical protein JCM11641_004648 [Rhodosporidiobolus odoratus]
MYASIRPLDTFAEGDEDDAAPHAPSTVPFTPPSTSHARQHSRIHERNLSAFFPRPGSVGAGYGGTYDDPHGSSSSPKAVNMSSFGADGPEYACAARSSPSTKTQIGRRGHHHRHSVSHNLFPFLDPVTSGRQGSAPPSSKPRSAATASVQLPASSASFRQRYGHLNNITQLFAYAFLYLPIVPKFALLLSAVQIAVGALLWVRGQGGESLATTGLGYLVVFDGVGGLASTLLERRADSVPVWELIGRSSQSLVRRPFGVLRLVTLAQFAQAVYLLFSAVYVCKESIEHVLLLHDPQDVDGAHGAGHGGVGHGEGRSVVFDPQETRPSISADMLLASTLISILLAVTVRNHQGLATSLRQNSESRSTVRRARTSSPSAASRLNPFTATVVSFGVALVAVSMLLPPLQVAPVDKILALLESLAMFYVAWPAAASTGQTLLQTAPRAGSTELRALDAVVDEIEDLPLVQSIESRHSWQLTSCDAHHSAGAHFIAVLVVAVKPDASDGDLLQLTQFAQTRMQSLSPLMAHVDLTVTVKRL